MGWKATPGAGGMLISLCAVVVAGCDPTTEYYAHNNSKTDVVFVRQGESRNFLEIRPGLTSRFLVINRSSRIVLHYKFGTNGTIYTRTFSSAEVKPVEESGEVMVDLWPGNPPRVVLSSKK